MGQIRRHPLQTPRTAKSTQASALTAFPTSLCLQALQLRQLSWWYSENADMTTDRNSVTTDVLQEEAAE